MNIAIQIKFEIYYSTMTKDVWIYYILYDKLLQKSVMATSRLYNTQRRKAPRHQH